MFDRFLFTMPVFRIVQCVWKIRMFKYSYKKKDVGETGIKEAGLCVNSAGNVIFSGVTADHYLLS